MFQYGEKNLNVEKHLYSEKCSYVMGDSYAVKHSYVEMCSFDQSGLFAMTYFQGEKYSCDAAYCYQQTYSNEMYSYAEMLKMLEIYLCGVAFEIDPSVEQIGGNVEGIAVVVKTDDGGSCVKMFDGGSFDDVVALGASLVAYGADDDVGEYAVRDESAKKKRKKIESTK